MDIRAEYYINQNEELSVLSESSKCKSILVRNKDTGELAVKKEMDIGAYEIYSKLKQINNKNIVNIIDCFPNVNKCITFEEYVNGKRLDSIISSRRISAKDAIENMIQLCNGLSEIHKCGIIHRDINPKNIIITTDNTVKLIDFDIARKEKVGATKDTELWGTVGYAAPEQYGFAQTDERSDIYSVGILLKAMLTGNEQSTMEDLRCNLISEQNIIKEKIVGIVKKCTEIDARNRYKTAEELLTALNNVFNQRKIDKTDENCINKLPPITWKYLLKTIPGFRRGNIFFIMCALIIYIFFLSAFISVGMQVPVSGIVKIYSVSIYMAFAIVPYIHLTNIGHIIQRCYKKDFKNKIRRIFYQMFISLMVAIVIVLVIASTLPTVVTEN